MLVNSDKADFELFLRNQDAYTEIEDFSREQQEADLADFLGPEYAKKPLYTLEELNTRIPEKRKRIEQLISLRAPEIIVDAERDVLIDLVEQLQRKEYIQTPAQKKYREDHERKVKEWADPKINSFWERLDKQINEMIIEKFELTPEEFNEYCSEE